MDNKIKIALAMIVKGSDSEADLLNRCLGYALPHVDAAFITVTQPNERVEQVVKMWGANLSHFEWCNDFAKARNFNFSQVPKEYDYILWLDADDVPRGLEKLRDVIEKHPSTDAFAMNYLYSFDEWNNPIVVHMKSRVTKNDGCVEWAGALHEDFKANRKVATHFVKGVEILHLTNDARINSAKERNLEVAKGQLEAEPNDPRSYWNVGNSQKALGKNQESIDTFRKFMEMSESDEEKYIVHLRIAESLWALGKKPEAIEEARYAIGLKPEYPDAYHLLGALFYEAKNFEKAKEMFQLGLVKRPPIYSIIVYNPRDYDYVPLMNLSKCYFSMGQPILAYEALKACVKIQPKDEGLKKILQTMKKEVVKFNEVSKHIEKLKKINDKEKLKEAIDKIPAKYQSHPGVCLVRNTHFLKEESSGKDLVIMCGYTTETWTPDTAKKKGIGGSEEAVIHLANRFSDLGWNVTVYNSCGHKEKKFGKVLYRPFWMWNYRDKQDVTILWRAANMLEYQINSKKIYLDLHDVIPPGELTEKRVSRVTKIFVKSKFHRELFPLVPDDKFVVVPNGIDTKVFDVPIEKDPMLIINTSSPDRSLSALLDCFEDIKSRVPEAKLKWAYGWKIFDDVHASNEEIMKWKEVQVERMRQLGVEECGRLSHGEVANLYLKANVFLYPTEFAEIHCISAVKAQAAGAEPICTDFAALDETVQFGFKAHSDKTKDTWAPPGLFDFGLKSPEKKAEIVEATVKQLKNPIVNEEMRQWAKKYDWGLVAKEWNNEFES